LAGVAEENAFTLNYGFWLQLSGKQKEKAKLPWGPQNPQALNRYSYVVNNPLRYIDPTGHYMVNWVDEHLTAAQVQDLIYELSWWIDNPGSWAGDLSLVLEAAGLAGEAIAFLKGAAALQSGLTGAGLLAVGATLGFTLDDLQELRFQLTAFSENGTKGVQLTMGANLGYWGISINNQEVVGHFSISPIYTPKGLWNLAPAFVLAWWMFDYTGGPSYQT